MKSHRNRKFFKINYLANICSQVFIGTYCSYDETIVVYQVIQLGLMRIRDIKLYIWGYVEARECLKKQTVDTCQSPVWELCFPPFYSIGANFLFMAL